MREAAVESGHLTGKEFDKWIVLEDLIGPKPKKWVKEFDQKQGRVELVGLTSKLFLDVFYSRYQLNYTLLLHV